MNYNNIINDIKSKKFEKIYFLHGEESFYIDKITNEIIENALEKHERDFNQTILYGKDSEAINIISIAKEYPMMAERRLVILKEAQDLKSIEELTPYFEDPSEQTILVINYKYKKYDSRKKGLKVASKHGVVFKSDKVPEYKLVQWINSFVESNNYKITTKASVLLSEFLGNDLNKIANEIEKLKILVNNETKINETHIEECIGISKDYNIYELINAISVHDVTKANTIVNYFNHNPKAGNIIPVIGSLFSHFSKLMKIHFIENKEKNNISSKLHVPPFVAGKLIDATRLYTPQKIAANIELLHEYDLKAKGVGNSSFNSGELMTELIYRLMN